MDNISVAEYLLNTEAEADLSERIKIGHVASQLYFNEFKRMPTKKWDEEVGRETNALPLHILEESVDIVKNRHDEWKQEQSNLRRAKTEAEREDACISPSIPPRSRSVSNLDKVFACDTSTKPDPAVNLIQDNSEFSEHELEKLNEWLVSGKFLPRFKVGVPCVIDKRTEKAIHCIQDDNAFWLPISRCRIQHQSHGDIMYGKVDVPLWLMVSHNIPIKHQPFSEESKAENDALIKGIRSQHIMDSEDPFETTPLKPASAHSNTVLGNDWYEKMQEQEKKLKEMASKQPDVKHGCVVRSINPVTLELSGFSKVVEVVKQNKEIITDDNKTLTKRKDGVWRVKGDSSCDRKDYLVFEEIVDEDRWAGVAKLLDELQKQYSENETTE